MRAWVARLVALVGVVVLAWAVTSCEIPTESRHIFVLCLADGTVSDTGSVACSDSLSIGGLPIADTTAADSTP